MPPDTATNDPAARHDGWNTLARFLPYLWPRDNPALRWRIVVAVILIVLSTAVQLTLPYLLKWAVDAMTVTGPRLMQFVMLTVLAFAAGRLIGVVFDNMRNIVFERVGQDATRSLAEHVFSQLHRLSLRFHLARRTGEVTKVIERGTKSIDTMLYFMLFNIAPTVLQLAVVAVIFKINFGWGLVGATALAVVAYIWVTRTITEWRTALREKMNQLDGQALSRAVDSLLNYETIKYFGAEGREQARYAQATGAYAEAAVTSENSLGLLNIAQALVINLLMAGALAWTVWGWAKGQYSAGQLVLVQTYLTQLFRPLDMLGMVYRTIRQGLIDMAAMFALTDTAAEIVDAPGALPLAVSTGAVRFEDVSFSYDPERQILKGVSFDIPAGGTLAVVGPSGAGKSTLARLMYRFYDVTGGRITIDGQDIKAVTQSSLRGHIGIVPQDTVLFNDTVGYNIAYGREGATQADVEAAARGAAIHNFIASTPDQYATKVGERGLKLSGGEKQRVAIARTLLKNPPILILDEATSALDSRTEAEIQTTLSAIAERRTTIIIAHRLSTIVDANEIVVLDAGQVVERGTHAALLGKNGLYAEMWARQAAEAEEAVAAE